MSEEFELPITLQQIGIKKAIRKKLARHNIETLEELLDTDYEDLIKIRQLGASGINEIKKVLHDAGYKIKNEENSLEAKREKLKSQGRLLLEDLGFPSQTYAILYKTGIFTIEQLNENWNKITQLRGYGPYRQQSLLEHLAMLGIEATAEQLIIPEDVEKRLKEMESKRKIEATELKQQEETEEWNILIKEYQALIAEKQNLRKREEEIDEELGRIRGSLSAKVKQKRQ